MKCQQCKDDKPVKDFDLTSRGTHETKCKKCCALNKADRAKKRAEAGVSARLSDVWPWKYNGKVYEGDRV